MKVSGWTGSSLVIASGTDRRSAQRGRCTVGSPARATGSADPCRRCRRASTDAPTDEAARVCCVAGGLLHPLAKSNVVRAVRAAAAGVTQSPGCRGSRRCSPAEAGAGACWIRANAARRLGRLGEPAPGVRALLDSRDRAAGTARTAGLAPRGRRARAAWVAAPSARARSAPRSPRSPGLRSPPPRARVGSRSSSRDRR
jgi:hypothetical protein